MLELHKEKIEYINRTAFELVALVDKRKTNNTNKQPKEVGSITMVPVLKVGEVKSFSIQKRTYKGQLLDYTKISGGYNYSISEDNHIKVEKLVSAIAKDKSVSTIVSDNFIREQLYSWVIGTYIEGRASQSFYDFLIMRLDNVVSYFQILVPITHLHIDKAFAVGLTDIVYFSKEKLAEYDELFRQTHSVDKSPYSETDSKIAGMVFCSCGVYAEPSKARDLAYELQSSAVDVLIITSETLDHPDFEVTFDLEHRNRHKLGLNTTYIIKDANPVYISPFHSMTPPQIIINEEILNSMRHRNFETFSSFLKNVEAQQTELGALIKNAIHDFANSMTNPDLHSRTAQIFSVIESLLLPNDNAPIIDSLKKYCPRIVTKNADDRSKISSMLSQMYNVRSGIVHHAKRIKFEISDLAQLQRVTNWLCRNLIHKLVTHSTKKAVLDEIDEALLHAG